MIDLIKDILTSPAGSFGFVFGTLALSYWLVHFVTKKVAQIQARHDELTRNGEKLESKTLALFEKLEHSGEKLENKTLNLLNKMEEKAQIKFDSFDGKIDEIRKDLAFLRGFMESVQKAVTDGYTQKHSPISLTEKGKKEVEERGLDKIVEKNWPVIFQTIEKEAVSKNPYDIQSYCMETAYISPEKFFSSDEVSYIKELAFKNGLALMTYTNMLAVLIRDKYFLVKGMNVDDVDKYAPSTSNP